VPGLLIPNVGSGPRRAGRLGVKNSLPETSRGGFLVCLHCRIARGSGQSGGFDVPAIVVFAASDRAAWRRPIGIGAIVDRRVHAPAPASHDITALGSPAHDEDSAALAGAALGSPSVMSKSAIYSRRPSAGLWAISQPTSAPKATISTVNMSAGTVMVVHPGLSGPGCLRMGDGGEARTVLFGEERRQDSISNRGG
jgi:hypothetical protein